MLVTPSEREIPVSAEQPYSAYAPIVSVSLGRVINFNFVSAVVPNIFSPEFPVIDPVFLGTTIYSPVVVQLEVGVR